MLSLTSVASSSDTELERIDYSNRSVWRTLFLLNVSTALNVTHLYMFMFSENDGMATLVNDVSLGFT